MNLFLAIIVAGLASLALAEVVLSVKVMATLLRRRAGPQRTDATAKAAVILPLRGADPSLRECLRALLQQESSDYVVHAVLDSRQDPAWPLVEAELNGPHRDRLRVHEIDNIPDTCSLKCAGVAEILGQLENDVEVILLVDADTVPAKTWLRHTADRLRQSGAAVVSGMRWFVPRGNGLAALVRYIWNAGSVVQMHRHSIAWGGCLALDRNSFDLAELADKLRHAYGEDTVLDEVIKERNLTMVFEPALTQLTHEDTTFKSFLGWAFRQMFSVRLHHSGWRGILLFGLTQWLLILAVLFLTLQGLGSGNTALAMIAGVTLLAYVLLQMLLLLIGEALVRRRSIVEKQDKRSLSLFQLCALPLLIPVTQLLHGIILITAALRRSVTWRGITYIIENNGKIRMAAYVPYVQNEEHENRSL